MSDTTDLLMAFYGDDITGSTDALDGLARNGVPSVLFIEPPTPATLDEFDEVRVIGIAGTSRAMSPAEMEKELPPVFQALAELDPPLVHYKVCSTFDSSPELGSIGKAIDLGQSVFESPVVPVSQGTTSPHGRYVVFGNLFAEKGGRTYRLDRHPTMSTHPRTPMTESDLRRHLGEQTARSIGLVDVQDVMSFSQAITALRNLAEAGTEIAVLDALDTTHLETIGRVLWTCSNETSQPLFCVGSSGLEHDALPPIWKHWGDIDASESRLEAQPAVENLLVMSGSAAPTTATQIDHAADNGFETIPLDTVRLVDPDTSEAEQAKVVDEAVSSVADDSSVILYSAKGSDDPMIKRTRHRFNELGLSGELGDRIGRLQGQIVADVLGAVDLQRACVAGGDTSGAVISELGITALEAIAPIAPGAPLCRARADSSDVDGLEIAFKGGQTGADEFFLDVLAGGAQPD